MASNYLYKREFVKKQKEKGYVLSVLLLLMVLFAAIIVILVGQNMKKTNTKNGKKGDYVANVVTKK